MTKQNEDADRSADHRESDQESPQGPPRQPPATPKDGERPRRGYFSKPKNWISLLTLIAVSIYTVITAALWCNSNRQLAAIVQSNRISQTSFVSAQRAYMYYDGVNYAKTEISPGVFTFSISPKISNSGNTPTKDLTIKVNCWLDQQQKQNLDEFRTQNIDRQNGFYGPRAILQAIECDYTLDQAKAILNKTLHSYAVADIRYKDFVDPNPNAPEHVTQFLLEFMISHLDETGGGLTGGTAQRGKHNRADENCPK